MNIQDVKDFLGLTNFKVLAGDLPQANYDYKDGLLYDSTGKVAVNFLTDLASLKQETQQESKNWILKSGGAALALLAGPLVAIFVFLALGNSHKICALIGLKNGNAFLAVIDSNVYQELLAILATPPSDQ